jgi:hypothetical protein
LTGPVLQEKALTFHMEFIEGKSEFTASRGWICCCGGGGIWVSRPLWRDATGKFGIILKFGDQLNSS